MKILVINCGSSSIKYKLFEFPKKRLLAKGLVERISESTSSIKNHSQGLKILISKILSQGVISNLDEISAVGHRVVHGGEVFLQPHVINRQVIKKIKECSHLAPLHNLANLAGIAGCRKFFPNIPQVAVFDTAFHQSIPESAYMYAIPTKYYDKYKVRKYGFHGTSHQFIAHKAATLLGKSLGTLKLITCHLGNGCSISAIDKSKVIDTSMGFTPLEGLMMGTRCGDIDVAVVFHIMEKEKLNIDEMNDILNKKSGFLGVSRISNDFRLIQKQAAKGNPKAKLALDMFIYRIKKYIGAYYFILNGVDAVCLTGGIGENSKVVAKKISDSVRKISNNKTKVLIIPADEELMIANLTYKLIKKKK